MLLSVNSGGVNWWGFAEGDASVLSVLVALVGVAALAYVIHHWIGGRGKA
jgi:hypothetical protein